MLIAKTYLYLDDAIFTGGRVLGDLRAWFQTEAPESINLDIVVFAHHSYGQYYARREITNAALAAGKKLGQRWWSLMTFEDSPTKFFDTSDVMRPTAAPDDELSRTYIEGMKYPPKWRTPGSVGKGEIFSSEERRHLLEQEFLVAGVKIREMCPYLPEVERPLGHHALTTLGFGSTIVTYRNCPNNAPLAWWVSPPWYPLLQRKTN